MLSDGLFDLQVNGYAGVDFNDPALTAAQMDHALEAMMQAGVTGCLPTIITAHPGELKERFRALDNAVAGSKLAAAMVPGYHLEGPFLSNADGYCGCHPASAMSDPDMALINELDLSLRKPILLITLAPERKGAIAAIAALKATGKIVSIGHSSANFEKVSAAVGAGASLSTHLGNGLPQQIPKLENTLLAQLAEQNLKACLIADGHHISPAALKALISLKGADNCILVTDAVLAASAEAGEYRFAGADIQLTEAGTVVQPGHPGLAGAALSLDKAVRNIAQWEIASVLQATRMASVHAREAIAPALRYHGITISPGKIAWNSALEPSVKIGASASN